MPNRQFKLTIRGEHVFPENVNFDELTSILVPLQKALEEIARARDIPFEHIPYFSLVNIHHGSVAMAIATNPDFEEVWIDTGTSISSNQYQNIPSKAVKKLQEVYKAVARNHLTLVIEDVQKNTFKPASISRVHPVPELPVPGKVSGPTAIYGKCVRINGETKDAGLIMFDADETRVKVQGLSEELIKFLGSRMFEPVIIEGNAEWETNGWSIVKFHAKSIREFNPSSEDLFYDLAKAVGEQLDTIDALEFIRNLRNGDEL